MNMYTRTTARRVSEGAAEKETQMMVKEHMVANEKGSNGKIDKGEQEKDRCKSKWKNERQRRGQSKKKGCTSP